MRNTHTYIYRDIRILLNLIKNLKTDHFFPHRLVFRTTADFLTSLCDPNSRHFQEGREGSTPKTAIELEAVYRKSLAYQRVLDDIKSYEKWLEETECADTRLFAESVGQCKLNHLSIHSMAIVFVGFFLEMISF